MEISYSTDYCCKYFHKLYTVTDVRVIVRADVLKMDGNEGRVIKSNKSYWLEEDLRRGK